MNENRTIWVIVGIVALAFLALLLYRSSVPEEAAEATQQVATSTAQSTAIAAARTEAAVDLAALRTRQEAGETYASLQDEYAEVRADLAVAYANAEGETKEEWTELSAEFDSFESSARAGTSNVLATLAALISRLSGDVGTENPGE